MTDVGKSVITNDSTYGSDKLQITLIQMRRHMRFWYLKMNRIIYCIRREPRKNLDLYQKILWSISYIAYAQKNHLSEVVLMNTHNIGFHQVIGFNPFKIKNM